MIMTTHHGSTFLTMSKTTAIIASAQLENDNTLLFVTVQRNDATYHCEQNNPLNKTKGKI